MAERKLARIQENGQVTLPAESRSRRGVKKGDLVEITETDEGWVITPREVVSVAVQDPSLVSTEPRFSLTALIAPGKAELDRLLAERYPDVASLRGAAGTLPRPMSWKEMREIARGDALGSVSSGNNA